MFVNRSVEPSQEYKFACPPIETYQMSTTVRLDYYKPDIKKRFPEQVVEEIFRVETENLTIDLMEGCTRDLEYVPRFYHHIMGDFFSAVQANGGQFSLYATAYATTYMNPLLDGFHQLAKFLPKVNAHLESCKRLMATTPPTLHVFKLIREVHDSRNGLNQLLVNICSIATLLIDHIAALKAKRNIKSLEIVDRDVAQESTFKYYLLLSAIQAVRKIQKGIIEMLSRQFMVPSGFEKRLLDQAPRSYERPYQSSKRRISSARVSVAPFSRKLQSKGYFHLSYIDKKMESARLEAFYEALICPLTEKRFVDPVVIITGQTFERKAVEEHFKNGLTCPLTKKKLESGFMVSNLALKCIILRLAGYAKGSQEKILEFVPEIYCPQRKEIFTHPVIIPNGMTYERASLTQEQLASRPVIQNNILSQLIDVLQVDTIS